MSAGLTSWDAARDFALGLAGSELSTSYGQPAVKVVANGRAFLGTGREGDTSFALHIDLDTVEMLKATEPETYWQTPHYEGYPTVLVRYDSADPERVRDMVRLAHAQAAAKPPAAKRKR